MPEIVDLQQNSEKPIAVLCGVDTGQFDMCRSMDELESLAETAGAEVVAHFVQRMPAFEAATCVGTGKLFEIADFCRNNDFLFRCKHGACKKNKENHTSRGT